MVKELRENYRKRLNYTNLDELHELKDEDEAMNDANGNELYEFKDEAETIYFGGGTPSLLTTKEIKLLLETVNNGFRIEENAEITLEANPDDISLLKLKEWKAGGINRLSIGVQSFHEKELQWMNRAHNAQQGKESILLAKEANFDNYSIDLIFGTPTLTNELWIENIKQAIDLGVPHISSYALTVEPKTPLSKMIALKKTENIESDIQARQFMILMDMLTAAGYEHYEISNFAKPGYRSRHNSSYWQGKDYLGIGPSAHSYGNGKRRWNISNNSIYIQSIQKGTIPFEEEILTPTQMLNEHIMISLRTIEGIDLSEVEKRFGRPAMLKIYDASKKYIEPGKMKFKNNRLTLTNEGKLFADGIAADMFE